MNQRLLPQKRHPSREEQMKVIEHDRRISKLVAAVEKYNLNDAIYSMFDGNFSDVKKNPNWKSLKNTGWFH